MEKWLDLIANELSLTFIISLISIVVSIFTFIKQNKYNIQLENLKVKNVNKNHTFTMFYNKSFESLVNLWAELVEIESLAEKLWERNEYATTRHLRDSLKNAQKNLKLSSIFISEELYKEIHTTLLLFDSYVNNKERLQTLRVFFETNFNEINEHINNNRNIREEYKIILHKLKKVINEHLEYKENKI